MASGRFWCIRPNGDRVLVTAEIGRLYDSGAGDWACPVTLRGLYDRLTDIHGVDSLQALCLAASLVRKLLTSFVDDGGRVLHPEDESEVDFNATFSGIGVGHGSV
ncbi:MAG: hypothetical protein ABSA52_15565 [Candidatus Binatia bacterium]